ncbi:MAG: gamma-glutamylcyclotransferase [Candidatus Heimdallarchaeota archaeon]|nr:MAG: gamma-glutamylcyclotransferase [Candidatus Heimdallarchaeota archaeon]
MRMNNVYCDNLFVYGTLMHGYSRNYLLQGLSFEKAILYGYRKVFPSTLGFPFIKKEDTINIYVEGEVYYGLTPSHWIEIDRVEGEGSLYHRILVEVETIPKRIRLSAFTYYPSQSLVENYS